MACLYVVATPIGNMEDITLRALRTLKEVPVIACEDTRHTSILLNHYGISGKKLIACHARNEEASARGVVKILEEGADVAYCSDAGTPGVSDPGSRLVRAVRDAGIPVVPLPGASAATTLVSAAGLFGKTFTFEGFLSPKSGRRRRRLEELLSRDEAFIIYESPFRIEKTLAEIASLAPGRLVVLGRELTKVHEEIFSGTAGEVSGRLKTLKGEFALCVMPRDLVKGENEEDGGEEGGGAARCDGAYYVAADGGTNPAAEQNGGGAVNISAEEDGDAVSALCATDVDDGTAEISAERFCAENAGAVL